MPEYLSLGVFDDIHMAQYIDPPLTTTAVDELELGQRTMYPLIERIEGWAKGCVEHRVGLSLVERSSTGPGVASPR